MQNSAPSSQTPAALYVTTVSLTYFYLNFTPFLIIKFCYTPFLIIKFCYTPLFSYITIYHINIVFSRACALFSKEQAASKSESKIS